MRIAVLGAGITGISAGYHLRDKFKNVVVYESRPRWGGLLDNFSPFEGFLFDTFVHLSFTKNEYVKNLFSKSTGYYEHEPTSFNLTEKKWLKHPIQYNLEPLESEEKVNIILDFLKRENLNEVTNYEEWLYSNFGKYFAQKYPCIYTQKYWCTEAANLNLEWIGNRIKAPSFEEILKGSFETQNENHYYAEGMRYPKIGGYKSFLNYMVKNLDLRLNHRVSALDLEKKIITFENSQIETYDLLISTIPLPELVNLTVNVPQTIQLNSKKLAFTSGQLVSIGFNKRIENHLWFYIYDQDFFPSRAHSPSQKSDQNAPPGKSSIQFETYFSADSPPKLKGPELIKHIIKKGELNGLFSKEDILFTDYREIKYANVVYNHERAENLKYIIKFYRTKGVELGGRFGRWEYLWSDQCLLDGKKIAEKFL